MILPFVMVLSLSIFVFAGNMEPKSVADVLSEIRQEQGIGSADTIKVDKVSDSTLE